MLGRKSAGHYYRHSILTVSVSIMIIMKFIVLFHNKQLHFCHDFVGYQLSGGIINLYTLDLDW